MSKPLHLKRREGLLTQRAGETVVLLDLESGEYYALDDVAGRVWDLCDGTRTRIDVVEIVSAEYDAPAAQVRADVEGFLEELIQERLLLNGD